MTFTEEQLRRIRNEARGALKATINDHGPITKELINSALKRLMGQLQKESHEYQPE